MYKKPADIIFQFENIAQFFRGSIFPPWRTVLNGRNIDGALLQNL